MKLFIGTTDSRSRIEALRDEHKKVFISLLAPMGLSQKFNLGVVVSRNKHGTGTPRHKKINLLAASSEVFCHSRVRGSLMFWIPAYAGMTTQASGF
jgi:hypothetical protein